MLEFLSGLLPSFAMPDAAFMSQMGYPISLVVNVFLIFGAFIILSNPTIRSLIFAWFMGKTWLLYERSNGALQPLAVSLEDGIYEDEQIGMFVSTPRSARSLPGGIKTANAYEGLASTIPSDFAAACKKAAKAGYENIDQLLESARQSILPGEKSEKMKKMLETIDFSIVRNFFLYDFSPRGMRARINRKVAIEMQKEKMGGLDMLLNPAVLITMLIVLIVIAVVIYPAVSSQASVTECQSLLTACKAAQASGVSVV